MNLKNYNIDYSKDFSEEYKRIKTIQEVYANDLSSIATWNSNSYPNDVKFDPFEELFAIVNGIASLRASGFSNDDKKRIKENWDQLSKSLGTTISTVREKWSSYTQGENRDINTLKDINKAYKVWVDAFNNVINKDKRKEDQRNFYVFPARSLATFLQGLVVNVISIKDLDILIEGLKKSEDIDKKCKDAKKEIADWKDGYDWLIKNLLITMHLKETIDEFKNTNSNSNDIEATYKLSYFGWAIKCYFSDNEMEKFVTTNRNVIFSGAPGTGKTCLARLLASKLTKNNKDHWNQVQFHPSYDYTDFIEGLRPFTTQSNQVGFKWHAGHFMNLCIKAANDLSNNYVFIIDEINRGEVNKIFGELFFSIDPDKRGEKNRIETQYSDCQKQYVDESGYGADSGTFNPYFPEGFYVPKNVYIIGTMNDIDRSVESLDFAFRRRFAWKEIDWDFSVDDILSKIELKDRSFAKDNVSEVKSCLLTSFTNLNKKIEEELGKAYCLGGSYLEKIQNVSSSKRSIKTAFTELWDNFLENVIKEYVRGTEIKDVTEFKNEFFKGIKE